jgi:two-component sensor histidine kinase
MVLSDNTRSTQKQNTAFLKDYLYQAAVENDLLPLAWLDDTRLFLFANTSFCNTLGIPGEFPWCSLSVEALPAPASTILHEVISHVTHSQKNTFEFYTETAANTSATIKVVKFGDPQHFAGAMITVAGGIKKPEPNPVPAPQKKHAPPLPFRGSTISGTQLTSLLSHELREPLRTIGNFSHLLDRRCSAQLNDAGREYLQFVRTGVAHLDSLFDDMLAMVKNDETCTQKEEIQTSGLKTILTAAYRSSLTGLNGQLTFESSVRSFWACPKKILPLFSHLIDNALKFKSPERSPVIVTRLSDNADSYRIEVADNGIGIPEEYREKIFLPFKRLHPRAKYPGNGAGLAICKIIVEQHGGTLWVADNDGPGSCFHFTLKK